MTWNFHEALDHYKAQGAPVSQTALIALLAEVQQEWGGGIPRSVLTETAAYYGVKEALLLALIRRIPRLRLADTHTLELCAGPSCGKSRALAAAAEKHCAGRNITLKFVPCMRQCAKGPNLKWDGHLYSQADETLLGELLKEL